MINTLQRFAPNRSLFTENAAGILHNYNAQRILLFGCFFFLITITYGPTLTANYAFADDYYCLWNRLFQSNWIYNIVTEGILQARPLNGALVAIAMIKCHSIGDYVWFHLFTIFQLTVLAYLTCKLLISSGWSKIQSFFLSLSLISLPPLQVILCWAITTFFVLSSILAILAVRFALPQTKQSDTKYLNKRMLIAFVCMFLSIIIYQPWSMFYWVGVAICLTSSSISGEQQRSYLIRFGSIFFVVALLDLLILRMATACFKHIAVSPERTHITHNVLQKISWFCTGPLVDALNFNKLMISETVAILAGLYIVTGLGLYFISKKRWQTFFNWLIALSLIPLSYLPNLAIAESFYTYRTELGLGTLILFYAYLSTRTFIFSFFKSRSDHLLTFVLVVTAMLNLFSAHYHVLDFFVKPQLYELNILKSQLRGDLGTAKQLSPVYSKRTDTIAPFNRHDEFGMPSFACPWIQQPATIVLREEIKR